MLSKNQLGFLYMFLSICAFSLMDVIVKWSVDYPIGQVLFFRGFCGIIPILFLIPKDRYFDFYKTARPFLHFKRCLAGLIALVSIFIALRNLPLATVVSITFAAPIFTTIFSIFLLNENQKKVAEKVRNEVNDKLSGTVVTNITLLKNYCIAEEYHQKYLEKR